MTHPYILRSMACLHKKGNEHSQNYRYLVTSTCGDVIIWWRHWRRTSVPCRNVCLLSCASVVQCGLPAVLWDVCLSSSDVIWNILECSFCLLQDVPVGSWMRSDWLIWIQIFLSNFFQVRLRVTNTSQSFKKVISLDSRSLLSTFLIRGYAVFVVGRQLWRQSGEPFRMNGEKYLGSGILGRESRVLPEVGQSF